MSLKELTPRVLHAKKRRAAAVPRRLELATAKETPQTGISNLTTSTSAVREPTSEGARNKVADQNEHSIYQLSNLPPSPLKEKRSPLNEEEDYDQRCYQDNAGAFDSEDESEAMEGATSLRCKMEDAYEAQESNNDVEDRDYVPAVKVEADAPVLLHGAPPGWKPPGAPDAWKPKDVKTGLGEPEHGKVDNPGGWSEFTFRPKWKAKKKIPSEHLYHQLPTGATPVPKDKDGKRVVNGWQCHYDNWMSDAEVPFWDGAERDGMFPKEGRERWSKIKSRGELLLDYNGIDMTRRLGVKGGLLGPSPPRPLPSTRSKKLRDGNGRVKQN